MTKLELSEALGRLVEWANRNGIAIRMHSHAKTIANWDSPGASHNDRRYSKIIAQTSAEFAEAFPLYWA